MVDVNDLGTDVVQDLLERSLDRRTLEQEVAQADTAADDPVDAVLPPEPRTPRKVARRSGQDVHDVASLRKSGTQSLDVPLDPADAVGRVPVCDEEDAHRVLLAQEHLSVRRCARATGNRHPSARAAGETSASCALRWPWETAYRRGRDSSSWRP